MILVHWRWCLLTEKSIQNPLMDTLVDKIYSIVTVSPKQLRFSTSLTSFTFCNQEKHKAVTFVVTEYTSFGFLLTTMCINKLSKLYLTEEGKSQRKPANSDKLQYVHLNGKCVLGVGVRKQPAHNRLHCSHQRSAWWDVRLSPPPLLHLCVHNYTATKNYRLLKCATFHNQHSAMQ